MTVILARAALAEALLSVFSEDLYVGKISLDDLTPEDLELCRTGTARPKRNNCGLYSMFRIFEQNGDAAFIRLAIEQLIKDGTERDYSPLMIEFHDKEDTEPVLRKVYQMVWGDLPEGPPPRIEYFNVGFAGEPLKRIPAWHAARDARYGPPPHDYEELRQIALSPSDPVFPVSGKGWTATPDGDGYSLTYLSGAHVPQEITVHASVQDIRALEDGTKFSEVVTPLVRAQNVKVI